MLDDIEWAKEIRALAGVTPQVKKQTIDALVSYVLLTDDPQEKHEIRSTLEEILAPYVPTVLKSERPIFKAPPKGKMEGDLSLGRVVVGDYAEGSEFRFPADLLCRGMLITGITGASKTTLIYSLVDQLMKLRQKRADGYPGIFWADTSKKDARGLLRKYDDFIVIPVENLAFSPLRPPPEMSVKKWWLILAEALGFTFKIYLAGVNYILEHLDQLYANYEKTGKFPTIHDLYELMISTHETNRTRADYFAVMWNRVRTLESTLGNSLNVDRPFPVELLKKAFALELHELRAADQETILSIILAWIYAYHLTQNIRGEELRLVIIADECQKIWGKYLSEGEIAKEMPGQHVLNLLPTQARDFGIGLVFATNVPHLVSSVIHSNTVLKISGNVSGIDVKVVGEAMGLD